MLVHSRLIRTTLAVALALPLLARASAVEAQAVPETAPPPAEETPEPAQETGPKYENTFKGLGQIRRPDPADAARAAAVTPPPASGDGSITCLAGCDGPRGAVVYRPPPL